MCILIFPSKIWAKKCALYTAKYGSRNINNNPKVETVMQVTRISMQENHGVYFIYLYSTETRQSLVIYINPFVTAVERL